MKKFICRNAMKTRLILLLLCIISSVQLTIAQNLVQQEWAAIYDGPANGADGAKFSCPNNFKTAGSTYEQPPIEENNLIITETAFITKLYPNPNNGRMQLDYRLEEGQKGTLEIHNISGKFLSSYRLQAGSNSLQINENTLANGIYFYRIIINDETLVNEKLIILK